MYPCSDKFHTAVSAGNDQKILMIFDKLVLTGEDINIDAGVEFDDTFNSETDLSIGLALSNEFRFSVFNDDRLLNSFTFGEFTATLGVYIDSSTYTNTGNVWISTTYANYTGLSTPPYLLRNGNPMSKSPGFPVVSLLAYDGKVFAFGASGQCLAYNDKTGARVDWTLHKFMKDKVKRWIGKGYVYDGGIPLSSVKSKKSKYLKIYSDGVMQRYEFVPLGIFEAERPKVPNQNEIDFECYDRMQKFEEDMPDAETLHISYPISIGGLFKALCDYVGVPYRTNTFINSDSPISEEPDDFDNVTMRTVIGWIAEAAASVARFDRDGYLVMDWLKDTDQSYDESSYSEFQAYWYETKKIDKLCVRDTSESEDETVGSGDNAYLIQDNPLIR